MKDTSNNTPSPQPLLRGSYDLRLKIGKALDRLVCDDSTPEQVDQFISTFAEFGLTISQAEPKPRTSCHPSHTTRSSDSSHYDEVCTKCGATDIAGCGWGRLAEPCTAGEKP
jgi:hypothetical protein